MAGKTWNGKSMGGSGSGRKGGGSIVSTTRNGSTMAQSKGQATDVKGMNIANASTPAGKRSPNSGGSTGSMPSVRKTHAGMDQAGDAGSGLGGSRKLGNHYSNS